MLARRPALAAETLLLGVWGTLLVAFCQGALDHGRSSSMWWCAIGPGGSSQGVSTGVPAIAAPHVGASLTGALPMWMLMSAAMMLPAALPAVRHVALNSLCWRRRRATLEFLGVYLAVWAVFGVVVLAVKDVLLGRLPAGSVIVALAAAVAWQLTVFKRHALGSCHRSSPLPPRGWRASLGVARFALRNGCACVGSCWALMLVMVLAGGPQSLWLIGGTTVVCLEKRSNRPLFVTRRVAWLLVLVMLCVALALLL
jgi:predicted metal-binding membrane protein